MLYKISLIISLVLLISLLFYLVIDFIRKLIIFFRSVDWRYVFHKFDIVKILGRLYFFNMLIFISCIDLIFLLSNNFQFNFANIGFTITFIILLFLTIFAIFKFIYSILLSFQHQVWASKILDFIERVITMSGVPRCGKTSSCVYISVMLAQINWHKLKREYWQVINLPIDKLTEKLKNNKNEVIKAYTFFMKNIKTRIPCLYSLTDIYIGKKKSYKLKKSMLLKKETLSYLGVFVVDEISTLFPNQNQLKRTDKKSDFLDVADFCKFIGQYLNGWLLSTEQNFGNAFKNIRDVTGLDLHYTKSQVWVCKPTFLLIIYNIFYWFFDWYLLSLEFLKKETKSYYSAEKNVFRSAKWWSRFMKFLSSIISNVGFRKYTFETSNSQNEKFEGIKTNGVFYLPAPLNAKYNDRYFRNKYECIDKPLKETNQNCNYYPDIAEIKEQFSDN